MSVSLEERVVPSTVSVTVTATLYVPDCDGLPEMVPLPLIETPAGRLLAPQVYVPDPPVADIVMLIGDAPI